jgi:hypothetical protein
MPLPNWTKAYEPTAPPTKPNSKLSIITRWPATRLSVRRANDDRRLDDITGGIVGSTAAFDSSAMDTFSSLLDSGLIVASGN